MKLKTPCIECGEPVKATRCEQCQRRDNRLRDRKRKRKPRKRPSRHARGYDNAWTRLSERARQLQQFCSDCGATDDLQADHSPHAWERWEKGLPLRLEDIDVVCGRCNRKRGDARAGSARSRSKATRNQNDTDPHGKSGRPSQGARRPQGEAPKAEREGLPPWPVSSCE